MESTIFIEGLLHVKSTYLRNSNWNWYTCLQNLHQLTVCKDPLNCPWASQNQMDKTVKGPFITVSSSRRRLLWELYSPIPSTACMSGATAGPGITLNLYCHFISLICEHKVFGSCNLACNSVKRPNLGTFTCYLHCQMLPMVLSLHL